MTDEKREDATPEEIRKVMKTLGSRGGIKGGPARAAKLTPKRRKEIARAAAEKRWGKKATKKKAAKRKKA